MKTPRFCVECGAPVTCANRHITLCAICLDRRRAEARARTIRILARAWEKAKAEAQKGGEK